MTNTEEQFRELYGIPSRHSEHSIGEIVAYTDPGEPSGRNSGQIIYIAEATADEPQRYIISPTIGVFPIEIPANEILIE